MQKLKRKELEKAKEAVKPKLDELKTITDIIEDGGELKTMDQSDDIIVKVNETDNDPVINVNNKEAVKKVKTMSTLVKNPKVVKEMKPKAVKTLFHTVATTITKLPFDESVP